MNVAAVSFVLCTAGITLTRKIVRCLFILLMQWLETQFFRHVADIFRSPIFVTSGKIKKKKKKWGAGGGAY